MSGFEELGLDPKIVRGIDQVGFVGPFPIQERSIGPLLQGADVIGQSRAGMGKTAAYGIPLLQIVDYENKNVQGLILAPTRELAVQITRVLRRLGKYTGARILAIYGGQPIRIQLEALSRGTQIVAGTPGRVIDLIKRGALLLDNAGFVVLDEADTMLDMGFMDDVEFILDSTPNRKQVSLFSATMPERIIQLAGKYMDNPKRILVDPDEPSLEKLDQYYTIVEEKDRFNALTEILNKERPLSAIVFCATKHRTRRLARELSRRFHRVDSIHGDLSQKQRNRAMNLFRSKSVAILVATDIAARGIDVPHVACVINYDVPRYPLIYFHRVGRTARAGRSGKSFTLVSRREFQSFTRIQERTNAKINPMKHEDDKISLTSHPERIRTKRRIFHRGSKYGYKSHSFYPSRSKPVEMGKEYNVTVEALSRRGDGIAKIQGFVIFIPETEVGERLKIRVTTVSSRHAIAEGIQQSRTPS
ncbi:MAG: DEAD/DEAH box helicase [Candidatus Bathyarchaeia archaeon]